MGVAAFIKRKGAAQSEGYSMTGATGWETVWLPAAAELGLDLIARMGDGSVVQVPSDELPQVTAELTHLREWMALHGHDLYVEHLDDIIRALATIRPGEDDVSFG